MAECEDEHLNIRINSTLKKDLKAVLPKYGFKDYSDFVRACAEQITYGNRSETLSEMIGGTLNDAKPLSIDPEIQQKFFTMLNCRFGAAVSRLTEKRARALSHDFAVAFFDESGVVLLPLEVQSLIKLYFSSKYFTPEVRQAYEQLLRTESSMDYQTELPETKLQYNEVKTA